MKPIVSVIVPVYNGEDTIECCLDSLMRQSLPNIEVICVNDGSTDNTLDILSNYEKKFNNIKVVTCKNGGRSIARNVGIEKCRTKYIMFCDDDDFYSPDMCRKMVNAMLNNDVDIAICGTNIKYNAHDEMRRSDEVYYGLKFSGARRIDDRVIESTDVSVWNKIFKREIIEQNSIRFPEKLNNEDYFFYNAYMSVSVSAYFLREKLYNYIRQEDSIMSNIYSGKESSWDHLIVAERLFDFYKKTGFLAKHKDLFWRQLVASYWFSLEHSTRDIEKKIRIEAKSFIRKNYKEWEPENKKVRWEVKYILTGDKLGKIKLKSKSIFARVLKKCNLKYRQQDYINRELEDLRAKDEELLNRVNDMRKRKNDGQQ